MTGIEALYIRRDQLTEDIKRLENMIRRYAIDREQSLLITAANDLADCIDERKLIMRQIISHSRQVA